MAKSLFGLQLSTHGRFSMVRHLILDFTRLFGGTFDDLKKKDIQEEWSDFLQRTRFTHSPYDVCFPNLSVLELELRDWFSNEHRSLNVSWQAMQLLSLRS